MLKKNANPVRKIPLTKPKKNPKVKDNRIVNKHKKQVNLLIGKE